MTSKDFKIWLVTNGFNQKSLAYELDITQRTVCTYVANERFPKTFLLSLAAITHGLSTKDTVK